MMTLADLQAQEAPATAPVEAAQDIPAIVKHAVELTKLGTEKARTRYFAKDGNGTSVLVYLPGSVPEQLAGKELELPIGNASSSTKKGRTKLTWEHGESPNHVTVYGYVPADAKHITGFVVQFPKGN